MDDKLSSSTSRRISLSEFWFPKAWFLIDCFPLTSTSSSGAEMKEKHSCQLSTVTMRRWEEESPCLYTPWRLRMEKGSYLGKGQIAWWTALILGKERVMAVIQWNTGLALNQVTWYSKQTTCFISSPGSYSLTETPVSRFFLKEKVKVAGK